MEEIVRQTALFGTGLIIGKFMPPHKGHLHLINTAKKHVKRLTVLVCSIAVEPIPGQLRYQWMQELCPGVEVKHHTDENPQEPHEHPDFWNIWRTSIRRICSESPDVVFASDLYGNELANRLGVEFIPVDPERSEFSVSGTQIRQDPYLYWEFIPECVRPYYAKRVVVAGAESTGKTTLARLLAERCHTAWLPEYGREHMDGMNRHPIPEDIELIARGHMEREDALVRKANRLLVCDTDLMVTCILSEYYFGVCPEWIKNASYERQYDLYLLTDKDIPWEEDAFQREGPKARDMLHHRFIQELKKRDLLYILISGTAEERLETSLKAINHLFSNSAYCPVL